MLLFLCNDEAVINMFLFLDFEIIKLSVATKLNNISIAIENLKECVIILALTKIFFELKEIFLQRRWVNV